MRPRLFDSLRQLLHTALGLGQVRLELLAADLQLEKHRLLEALLRVLAGLMLLGLGLVLLIAFLLLLLWDGYRLPALGVLTLLCVLGGAMLLSAGKRRFSEGDDMFAATLGELERDQAALRPRIEALATSAYDELLQRRERLLMRSHQLRQDWSVQVQVLRTPLGLADQARAATAWVAQNPLWPLGGLALFALLRPGRVLRWSGLAWQGWATYRRVQRLMGNVRPPHA